MCSLIEFVDNQRSFIESERSFIETLTLYLDNLEHSSNSKQKTDNGLITTLKESDVNDGLIAANKPFRETHSTTHLQSIDGKHVNDDDVDDEDVEDYACLPLYITPRSRLLSTHSSRLRAEKYKNELLQQIEDNQRRKAAESERLRKEEKDLERRVEEQRLQMLSEYEREQRYARRKTDQVIRRQEMANLARDRDDVLAFTSRQKLLRSPSYVRPPNDRVTRSPIITKIDTVSRSLNNKLRFAESETTGESSRPFGGSGDNGKTEKTDKQLTQLNTNVDSNQQISLDLNTLNENEASESDRRVISHLSEVRQMIAEDHIRMLEQLRSQQTFN